MAGFRLRDALGAATTQNDAPNVERFPVRLDDLAAQITRTNNALVKLQADQHEIERNIELVQGRLRELREKFAAQARELGIKAEVV